MSTMKYCAFAIAMAVAVSSPVLAKKNEPAKPSLGAFLPPPVIPDIKDFSLPMPGESGPSAGENEKIISAIPNPDIMMGGDHITARMGSLKESLKIREDQLYLWEELVSMMKQNEKIKKEAEDEDRKNSEDGKETEGQQIQPMFMIGGETLPKTIERKEKNMHMQYDGLQRIKPVLMQLYNALDDEQKKTMDQQMAMDIGLFL